MLATHDTVGYSSGWYEVHSLLGVPHPMSVCGVMTLGVRFDLVCGLLCICAAAVVKASTLRQIYACDNIASGTVKR